MGGQKARRLGGGVAVEARLGGRSRKVGPGGRVVGEVDVEQPPSQWRGAWRLWCDPAARAGLCRLDSAQLQRHGLVDDAAVGETGTPGSSVPLQLTAHQNAHAGQLVDLHGRGVHEVLNGLRVEATGGADCLSGQSRLTQRRRRLGLVGQALTFLVADVSGPPGAAAGRTCASHA